jgi:hypothetical protein
MVNVSMTCPSWATALPFEGSPLVWKWFRSSRSAAVTRPEPANRKAVLTERNEPYLVLSE